MRRIGQDGFTLFELIVVIAIIATLVGIASLGFREMSVKSGIEKQTKEMYADLMTVRSEALFRKRARAVVVTTSSFSVYSSDVVGGTPLFSKNLPYGVSMSASPLEIEFDSQGLASISFAICAQTPGKAASDSIAATQTMIQMGRQKAGGCSYANVEQ